MLLAFFEEATTEETKRERRGRGRRKTRHSFACLVLKLQRLPLRAPRGLGCPTRPALLVGLDGEEVPDLVRVFFGFWYRGGALKKKKKVSGRRRPFSRSVVERRLLVLTLSIIPRLLALLLILTVRSLLRRPMPSVTTALCDSRTPASPRRSVTKSERMGGGGVDPGIFVSLFLALLTERALSLARCRGQ